MKNSENIICFSSIDWDFIWQTHQQIMQSLANQGHRILFIENTGVRTANIKDFFRLKKRFSNWRKGTLGIRQVHTNIYVYSPLLLPAPYSKTALFFNSIIFWKHLNQWIQSMDFHTPIIWSFLPTILTNRMISKINKKLTIYHCVDKLSESSKQAKKIIPHEKNMIKQSDLVFATSHQLVEYCSAYHEDVHLFPSGVDIVNFQNKTFSEKPLELKSLTGSLVGYIGGVHQWLDLELIHTVATAHSDTHFVFIGPIQTNISILQNLKNIHFISQKHNLEIPQYLYFFDVCIIPYKITPYTHNVYPSKLNEYLAMGKRVIATPLKEIHYFNKHYGAPITIASSPEEFSREIKTHLQTSQLPCQNLMEIAKLNSWDKRISDMTSLIDKKINEKELNKEKKWIEMFKRLSNHHSNTFLLFLILIPMLYTILFQTSLPWYVAQPLKIVHPLKKSDIVIVLGGGVGESGQAGQGYQERVLTAATLYTQGYSPNILFSSGYRYLIKETDIMKKLAITLGIPSAHIYVEDKGGNTFENLKFSSDIIQKNNFHRIIIVSSPYHLKRAALVAKKQFPKDVEIIMYPVSSSLFFGSLKKAPSLKQLKAITHEYLAIVYYKFKGYL